MTLLTFTHPDLEAFTTQPQTLISQERRGTWRRSTDCFGGAALFVRADLGPRALRPGGCAGTSLSRCGPRVRDWPEQADG